jgi:subtilisin family serine protease
MDPLGLVNLTSLMQRTYGCAEVAIGLIDGPVATDHPDLARERVRDTRGPDRATCQANRTACLHGTFVAGILSARRTSSAPAICPGCTLVVRPIFLDTTSDREQIPHATPNDLAAAIFDCIEAGTRVINLSLGLAHPSTTGERCLGWALDHAIKRGVIVVAAAGNQATLGSSALTRHPWVIPVIACDLDGRPTRASNLGHSIGSRGLSAPGDRITSLGAAGPPLTLGGTSVAAPFVTGATALLWSTCPDAPAAHIKLALTASTPRRTSVAPPLLDAAAAYERLATARARG